MMYMHAYSMGGWMWVVPAFTFLLFFWGVYLLVRRVPADGHQRETPMEILKQRYARGELSREEFEEMKRAM